MIIRIFQTKPEILRRLYDWMIISFNYSFTDVMVFCGPQNSAPSTSIVSQPWLWFVSVWKFQAQAEVEQKHRMTYLPARAQDVDLETWLRK
jgi:hypothetical protein